MILAKVNTKILEYAELVKFEHTIFALPFALSAMLLACPTDRWPDLWTVTMIIFAMVGGRTFAMALNRLIDANIDAKNPRTQNRSIPAGRVKKLEAALLAIASGLVLTLATFQLPIICQQLLPIAFGLLIIYSYIKRFSNMAHLVLGLALGSSAIGGWVAVTGQLTWLPIILGFAVTYWVAGFDIIYACQDTDFDKEAGLHSIPATIGIKNALILSKVFHILTVLLMAAFAVLYTLNLHTPIIGFYLATIIMAGFLVYEHQLVSSENLEKVNEAFFVVNGRISLSIFAFVLLDKLVHLV